MIEIWGVKITRRLFIWLWFLIILIIMGLYGFTHTLFEGHFWTGLNVPSLGGAVWGLYVVNYIFLIGASAGGFIIAASAHIFNVEKYKPISTLATLLALTTILLPPVFIASDLGRPDRMLHVAYPTPNFKSPLFFVLLTLSLYIILLILELWFSMRRRWARKKSWLTLGFDDTSEFSTRKDEFILKILSIVGLPLAVSVHSVTGWIFGLIKSRPFWLSPLMAPIFLSSALVSGIALVIFTCIVLRKFAGSKIEPSTLSDLARLLFVMIPVDLFFLGIEVLTTGYAHEPTDMKPLLFLLIGTNAPLFWFEVIAGGLVPFIILAFPRFRASSLVLAITSLLVVIGIWLKRFNLLEAGILFSHELFGWAEYPLGSYTPSWVEWSVMAGVYGIGLLLFTLAFKFFPIIEEPATKPIITMEGIE